MRDRVLRLYLAGPMSGSIDDYLYQCGEMLHWWQLLAEYDYAVYCPAADALLGLAAGCAAGRSPSIDRYRAWSMAWLEAADAVYVIGTVHRDGSPADGVLAEVERAHELGIPVFDRWCDLREWAIVRQREVLP